jgi:hypothetical protein
MGIMPPKTEKRGSLMHIAPTYTGSGEGSDHFESYACSLSLHFWKRLFPGLEPMVSRSQGNNFTAVPGLPFKQPERMTIHGITTKANFVYTKCYFEISHPAHTVVFCRDATFAVFC